MKPFWESIKEFPTSCGDVGWNAMRNIATLLAEFRQRAPGIAVHMATSSREDLVHRLRDHYGGGGFLHFGQGKWYPGEQLPRWALSICWRADGQPCWSDPTLFADEREPHHYSADDARAFVHALAARLGLPGEHVQAGYEDTWYYLWRERRLPANVDPFDARLEDPPVRLARHPGNPVLGHSQRAALRAAFAADALADHPQPRRGPVAWGLHC